MIHKIEKDKEEVFRYLYSKGFNEINTSHNPPDVYTQSENNSGKIIGMYAGYAHDKYTWYLQFSARFGAGTNSQKYFNEFIQAILKDYRYVMCAIENTNMAALMRVLRTGFRVIGVRQPLNNPIILVELVLDRENMK